MIRKIFLFVVLALVFALALNVAPLGMASAQTDEAADPPLELTPVKMPPGYAKAAAEVHAARAIPPRAGLDRAQWSLSMSHPSNSDVRMIVFKDHLYAAFGGFGNSGEAAQIFRSTDGETWEPSGQPAFGYPFPVGGLYYSSYFYPFYIYQGQLYVGLGLWRTDTETFWEPLGGQLWRTADGITWEKVVDLASDPQNEVIAAWTDFKGYLYATTDNWFEGFEVWRSPSGDAGSWTKIAENSLGTGLIAGAAWMVAVNDVMTVEPDVTYDADGNLLPVHVWSTRDGVNYELVTADGFGHPGGTINWGRLLYRGSFYVWLHVENPEPGGEPDWIVTTQDGVNWSLYAKNQVLGVEVKGHLYSIWYDDRLNVYRSTDLLTWDELAWQPLEVPGIVGGWGPYAVFKNDLYFPLYDADGMWYLWRLSVGEN